MRPVMNYQNDAMGGIANRQGLKVAQGSAGGLRYT